MSMGIKAKEAAMLIVIFLVSHVPVHFFGFSFLPDESVYSMMIEEQIAHPSIVMTFMGDPVAWKPPLFFWTYAPFVMLLRQLPVPLELIYRFPTMIFGAINVFLAYFICKECTGSRTTALTAAAIYAVLPVVVYTDSLAQTDTIAMTFVLGSIYQYLKGDERSFLIAGGLTCMAFFTKGIIAFVAIAVAIAFLFEKKRTSLAKPAFALSLLPLLICLAGYYIISNSSFPPGSQVDFFLFYKGLIGNFSHGPMETFMTSSIMFCMMAFPWFIVSIYSLAANWKGHKAISIWFLSLLPIFAFTNYQPWYLLVAMFPLSFFAALLFPRDLDERTDKLAVGILIILAAMGLLIGYMSFMKNDFPASRSAGQHLSFSQNVLIIGDYDPVIVAYKVLPEIRAYGRLVPFGWVISHDPTRDEKILQMLENDYSSDDKRVKEGHLFLLYADSSSIYRTRGAPQEFDRIMEIGFSSGRGGNSTISFDGADARVFFTR